MTDKELEQIYNESYKAVYWTAMSLLKNEADAEDVVQDTFISFIESYGNMTDLSKAVALLKKIAANKCLDRIKLARTDAVENEFFEDVEALPEDFLPDSIVESEEMRKVIMNIINNVLSDEIRRTLVLFYFDDMSTKEIAEVMGIPQGTVTWRLSFAKQKVKKEVEKYEKDNDTKLFGMVMIPFFTQLFTKEAEQTAFKPMPASLLNLSASTQAPSPEAGIETAKQAATKGTGASMKKILIGSIAATVAVGITLGIILGVATKLKNKGSDTDSPWRNKSGQSSNPNGEEFDPFSPDGEDDGEAVPPETYPVDPNNGYRIITFGRYRGKDVEWLVLDENESGMLLLSRKVIEGKPFHEKNVKIYWKDCTLRQWMNTEFYNELFNAEEKKRVIKADLENYESPEYGAKVLNHTEDYVFLLSTQELDKYFYRAIDVAAWYESYLTKKEILNISTERGTAHYWLRTSGKDPRWVTGVGYTGSLNDGGNSPETSAGIRPAIWLSHEPLDDVSKPVPTATPEQLEKRTVTVEDAFSQQFETDDPDEPLINRYPKVTISGVDTSVINNKMKYELKRKVNDPNTEEIVDYQYYISKKYVSIVAKLSKADEAVDYKVYNISIATGHEVDGRRLLEDKGLKQEALLNKAKKQVKKYGTCPDETPLKIERAVQDKNLDRISFAHLKIFYSPNGHICVVSTVTSYTGEEEKDTRMAFDLEKRDYPYDWGYYQGIAKRNKKKADQE